MKHSNGDEEYSPPHRHDRFIMFVCFLTSALIGYVLTNHVALLGV
jgi:hypothetical protein